MIRALVLLLAAASAQAAPLDDALALVRANHPALAASRSALAEQSRQRDWNARVSFGWTQKGTDYGGQGGPNAGVQLAIPLFDRKHELDLAKAQAEFAAAEQQVVASFLSGAASLAEKGREAQGDQRMLDFLHDRLAYRKQRVDEGLEEADALWREAEAVQTAERAYGAASEALAQETERLAREYGGAEWKQLRDLLAGHAKPRP